MTDLKFYEIIKIEHGVDYGSRDVKSSIGYLENEADASKLIAKMNDENRDKGFYHYDYKEKIINLL